MKKRVLYIQASPRAGAYSRAVADAFIRAYRERNPADEIVTLDVFGTDLPAFDGVALQSKYNIMHGRASSDEEMVAWRKIEKVIEEFKSFDKYVMAVPMWNFGIPYRLKQYLDVIVQPTYTFSFSPAEGYKGLVTGKPIVLVCARGGEYSDPESAVGYDFQKRYLELELGFIGFTDIRSIVIEPTLAGGPDTAAQKREVATAAAREMAKSF
jgi:FMN-dependent NADH-azoreductase